MYFYLIVMLYNNLTMEMNNGNRCGTPSNCLFDSEERDVEPTKPDHDDDDGVHHDTKKKKKKHKHKQ